MNPKDDYCAHKRSLFIPSLNQMNPSALHIVFLKITLRFPPVYASIFTDFSFLRVFRLRYYINYSLRFYEYILIEQVLILRGLLYTVVYSKTTNLS